MTPYLLNILQYRIPKAGGSCFRQSKRASPQGKDWFSGKHTFFSYKMADFSACFLTYFQSTTPRLESQ